MARPRIIRVGENGEITLKNIDPAMVAKIEAVVGGVGGAVEAAPIAAAAALPVGEDGAPMHSKAVGTYMDPTSLHWHVAVINFSHSGRKGVVTSDLDIGTDKEMLRERFKITVVKEGLLG